MTLKRRSSPQRRAPCPSSNDAEELHTTLLVDDNESKDKWRGCLRSTIHSKRRFLCWMGAATIPFLLFLFWSNHTFNFSSLSSPGGKNKGTASSFGIIQTDPSLIVPTWQSIVADTGEMYPLMTKTSSTRWTLASTDGIYKDIAIRGTPGDIISDLMEANLLDEPYFDSNFITQRHVWTGNTTTSRFRPALSPRNRTWVYTTNFDTPSHMNSETTLLILEGIKMGAFVEINGQHVGNVTDQFLRYQFNISPLLNDNNTNSLSITFDPSIVTNGRFMGCSGGWDWAPYVPIGDERGSRLWTFGIFREAYLVQVQDVYIAAVVPKVYYTGQHATQPMVHGAEADFQVLVEVHVVSPGRDYTGDSDVTLEFESEFSSPQSIKVPSLKADEDTIVSFNMTVSKHNIELWWPNGMGSQPLYKFQVQLMRPGISTTSPVIQRKIGFRTAALVTINDTNDTSVRQAEHGEGSGTHGMYFRINGALVWARGGNMVPMDQLEGRLDDEAHRELVRSAAAANMNMLRIWGGGMVLPEAFYDECDEQGISIFHDMMFVQEHNHGAIENPTVTAELRHLIRSLSSHASIVLWNGCNECTSLKLFASFVMRIVAKEDDTRAIWPSSPSSGGWATGVHTLDGRPNGNELTIGRARKALEKHSPYGHSYSITYPSVNSVVSSISTNTPPNLAAIPIGPMYQNQFSSEFGSSVMSSFESMSATLSPRNWNIHGGDGPAQCIRIIGHDLECTGKNVMSQRNYACDSHILKYFGSIPFGREVGARAFQAQLFECMMGQALWMKGQFENLRSQNSFGALIWQLNENWPTGGWGSIEYGSPTVQGQVIGGRWKPLMHIFQNSILREVFAACGSRNQCFVRNDGTEAVHAEVIFEYWVLSELEPIHTSTRSVFLQGGIAATERFELPDTDELSRSDVILIRVQDESNGKVLMKDNAFLKDVPSSISGLTNQNVTITTSVSSNGRGATVSVTSDSLALYVTLTTTAQGRFSENVLHLRPNTNFEIHFDPPRKSPAVDIQELERTLRVEHLGMYMTTS